MSTTPACVSPDRGRCYLRNSGTTIVWYCERAAKNPKWSNVFSGRVKGETIEGEWVDVPKGSIGGNGRLRVKISATRNELSVIKRTGSRYGGSRWTRVK